MSDTRPLSAQQMALLGAFLPADLTTAQLEKVVTAAEKVAADAFDAVAALAVRDAAMALWADPDAEPGSTRATDNARYAGWLMDRGDAIERGEVHPWRAAS